MLLAWLGLLRLDFTADMNGFYRPLAIKNLPSSSGFENFFDHFFTISLLNTTYTESIKENLSMLSSSSTPHKIFTKKIFGLKPQQYGSRLKKNCGSLPGHTCGVYAFGVMIQSSVESSGWNMHGITPSLIFLSL